MQPIVRGLDSFRVTETISISTGLSTLVIGRLSFTAISTPPPLVARSLRWML